MRALRRLKREYPDGSFLFVTERGGAMTRSTVNKLLTVNGVGSNF